MKQALQMWTNNSKFINVVRKQKNHEYEKLILTTISILILHGKLSE